MSPLEWTLPPAWIALLVPAALLVLARRRRSERVPTGSLALWREVAAAAARGRSRDAARPLGLWLAALALVLGIAGLAGPRGASGGSRWTLVVDGSASMGLGDGGSERRAAALARGLELLAERARGADSVRVTDGLGRSFELPAAGLTVAELERRLPRPAGEAEPPWSRFDRAGALWITDRSPSVEPGRAGWVAVGGAAAPGPCAVRDGARLVWSVDGSIAAGAPCGLDLALVAAPLPLAALALAWAEARGFEVDEGGAARLAVVGETVAGPARLVGAGDGWSIAGPGRALEPVRGERVWVRDADGAALVAWSPGTVRVGLTALTVAGDADALAVAFAELLDRAWSPPPDVVPVSERAEAGPGGERAPRRPPDARRGSTAVASVLAALAALLGGVALALRV